MYDILVAGAGPAGLTAALYAARAGKKVLILESNNIGGQANYSPLIENYPGLFAVSGTEFAETLKEQVLSKGVEIRDEKVTVLVLERKAVEAETLRAADISDEFSYPRLIKAITDKNQYSAKAVILALGLEHRRLGLSNEDELIGMGVSYCAVCDGAFFGGANVAVVGGGNSALQEALYLSSICSNVTLIHRREEFRGEKYLVSRLKEKDNVKFLLGYTVSELLSGDGELKGLKLKKNDVIEEIAADGLFVSIGRIPGKVPDIFLKNERSNSDTARGMRDTSGNDASERVRIDTDSSGFIITGEDCAANISGIFAAGDCRAKKVRQLTTAVGDGAQAALSACEYIRMSVNDLDV